MEESKVFIFLGLNVEFWISLIFALIGIFIGWQSFCYSKKSYSEAKGAKQAAQEAGKTVRKQDIIVVLTEMLNECNIDKNIEYFELSRKHTLLHKRVSNIRGLYYSSDLNVAQQGYLSGIEASLAQVRSQLDLFNPTVSADVGIMNEEQLFMALESPMTILSGNIELFKGTMQNSLI